MATNETGVGGNTRPSRLTEVMVGSVVILVTLLAAYVLVLRVLKWIEIGADTAAWVAWGGEGGRE